MFTIGPEHAIAQLIASLAFADAALSNSTISFYTTVRPPLGAPPGAAAQVVITLGKPCGVISGSTLTLNPVDPGGSMVLTGGIPKWARWERSDGLLVADGDVTDASNGGDFTLTGGATAPGELSPTLYAGGLVFLGTVDLT